jgi:hypothetical protein
VKRFQLRLREGAALGLVAWLSACGRTSNDDEPEGVGGVAGQSAGDSGGVAGSGGSGGLQLAGALPIAGDATSGSGGSYVALPLEDTALCENNLLERVEQLPDEPFSFAARFDGEPVEVQSSATPDASPLLSVFRFGRTHVEALSFDFEFAGYEGGVSLSAGACGHDGYILKLQDGQVVANFVLSSGKLSSHTSSVDGFTGVSRGSLYSEWSNETGEKHVFEASFFMRARMPDARAEQL